MLAVSLIERILFKKHFPFTGVPGIRSRFAKLSVLVPPDPPKIIQGSHMMVSEGKEVSLECVSYGGKPAAEVRFERKCIQKTSN